MSVVLLLVVIWALILVPPALRAHAARKEAFLVSFGEGPSALSTAHPDPDQERSTAAGASPVAS